jgi:hypothetical protein
MGHFAWGLAEIEEKETSLSLVERLLQLKDLRRIDKLMLEHVRKFLEDEENCKKALEREEEEKEHSIVKLVLTGVLNSSFRELVPDGPRPVINDDSVREYLPLMYSIEHPIFSWYKEHPSLKDSDVIELLKNIRDGIWKDYEGKNEFEKSFIAGLKLSVFELNLRYTKGEVSACISRVLNSVKRHRESEGERGYLEFIKNFSMKEGPV